MAEDPGDSRRGSGSGVPARVDVRRRAASPRAASPRGRRAASPRGRNAVRFPPPPPSGQSCDSLLARQESGGPRSIRRGSVVGYSAFNAIRLKPKKQEVRKESEHIKHKGHPKHPERKKKLQHRCEHWLCQRYVAGLDVNDILDYTTPQRLSVRDRRIGCLYYCLVLTIVFYIIIVEFWKDGIIMKPYYPPAHAEYAVRHPLFGNQNFACTPSVTRGSGAPPPAQCDPWCDKTKDWCWPGLPAPDGLPYCEGSQGTGVGRKPCAYWDYAVATTHENDGVSIATRLKRTHQKYNCDHVNTFCELMWSFQGERSDNSSLYTVGPEDFLLLISHMYDGVQESTFEEGASAGGIGGARSGNFRNGLLHITVEGTTADTLCNEGAMTASMQRPGSSATASPCKIHAPRTPHSNVDASLQGKDYFSLGTLLAAVDVTLDDVVSSNVVCPDGAGTCTVRDMGISLLLVITWKNWKDWDFFLTRNPFYEYEVKPLIASYHIDEIRWLTGISSTAPVERLLIERYGVRIVVLTKAEFKVFSLPYLLVAIAGSLTLIAVANKVADCIAFRVIPMRKLYRAYWEEQTMDFTKLQGAMDNAQYQNTPAEQLGAVLVTNLSALALPEPGPARQGQKELKMALGWVRNPAKIAAEIVVARRKTTTTTEQIRERYQRELEEDECSDDGAKQRAAHDTKAHRAAHIYYGTRCYQNPSEGSENPEDYSAKAKAKHVNVRCPQCKEEFELKTNTLGSLLLQSCACCAYQAHTSVWSKLHPTPANVGIPVTVEPLGRDTEFDCESVIRNAGFKSDSVRTCPCVTDKSGRKIPCARSPRGVVVLHKESTTLPKGLQGVVEQVDPDGHLLIKFGLLPEPLLVKQNNVRHITVTQLYDALWVAVYSEKEGEYCSFYVDAVGPSIVYTCSPTVPPAVPLRVPYIGAFIGRYEGGPGDGKGRVVEQHWGDDGEDAAGAQGQEGQEQSPARRTWEHLQEMREVARLSPRARQTWERGGYHAPDVGNEPLVHDGAAPWRAAAGGGVV